jgi:membrane-associated phospholipid phosphatase
MPSWLALLLAALGAVSPPAKADEDNAAEPTKVASHPEDGRRTLGRLPANLGRGAIGVFGADNARPALIGGALTGGAAFLDNNVMDAIADPDAGFGKAGEKGGGAVLAALGCGIFIGGRFAEGHRFRATTYDVGEAVAINGVYTELLKAAVGRERPNGANHKSFPSGHTSNAFAIATVFTKHMGRKAAIPAYAVASLVGISRLQRNQHYLSDILAGATLGHIVGRTVVRANDEPLEEGKIAWSVAPIAGRGERGIALSVSFR